MALIADTHALLWYINDSPELSNTAFSALESVEQLGEPIYVPSICLVEIRYLVEKGKDIEEADYQTILALLLDRYSALTLAPLDLPVAEALAQIPRSIVPDMPDRIIAATALVLGLPLVTRDHKIQALTNIKMIW